MMIGVAGLFSVALAGDPCEKMSEAEKQEVADWLQSVADPVQKEGKHPKQKTINQVEDVWAAGKLCTPMDKFNAATLMAYGFSRGSTRAAYEVAKEAMAEHAPGSPHLVATVYDRYLVVRAQPQRYATMEGTNRGKPCLFPMEPNPADDAERKQYGLGPLVERYAEVATRAGVTGLNTYTQLGQNQLICPPRGDGKKLRTK